MKEKSDKTLNYQGRELTEEEISVTQGSGTEPPFNNKYWDENTPGIYRCVVCGLPLFNSETKFKSGTGWPSFYAPIEKSVINSKEDKSYSMSRIEAVCSKCGSHLGHIFNDGPQPTGLRYCMNSASLELEPTEGSENSPASQ